MKQKYISMSDLYSITTLALRLADDDGYINGIAFTCALDVAMIASTDFDGLQEKVIADLQEKNVLTLFDELEKDGVVARFTEEYSDVVDLVREIGANELQSYREYRNSAACAFDEIRHYLDDFKSQLNETVTPENINALQEFAAKWGKQD